MRCSPCRAGEGLAREPGRAALLCLLPGSVWKPWGLWGLRLRRSGARFSLVLLTARLQHGLEPIGLQSSGFLCLGTERGSVP